MQLKNRPVVLIIRDGWGQNPHHELDSTNALLVAKTPVNNHLVAEYPTTLIETSGEAVGLPVGVMGNSEVGHQNIGAGRIVDQEVMRITRAIRNGSFFENPVLRGAFEHAMAGGGSVHIMGLLSDGRVHSDMQHAYAIAEMGKKMGLAPDRFIVHALMDGRDTPPNSGKDFLAELEAKLKEIGVGRVGTVVGRFYAMDRDNRWDRVKVAYDALTKGSDKVMTSAVAAAEAYYAHPAEPNQLGDEFIKPVSISPSGKVEEAQKIKPGDAVIFFNFRGDRTREISKAFSYDEDAWKNIAGGGFDRGGKIPNLYFAGMTGYEKGLPIHTIFEKLPKMTNILGDWLAKQGLKQFRSAETEKFAHVTFFFNDYREEPFPGEDRTLIPSPREVATYDEKPAMSAVAVTDEVVKRIESGQYDVVIMNFANCDMVGHTGILKAAVAAAETVDQCVGRVVDATLAQGGALVITADHGNCEQLYDPLTHGPHTAHTTYDVPLIVVDGRLKGQGCQLKHGSLADVAPTVLDLLGVEKPAEMTGQSLVPAECWK